MGNNNNKLGRSRPRNSRSLASKSKQWFGAKRAVIVFILIYLVSFFLTTKKQLGLHNHKIKPLHLSDLSGLSNNHTSSKKMSILISTFKQPTCLHRLIMKLQECNSIVENIHVNWFEESTIPQSLANNSKFKIPVLFDRLPNKLSHRFLPRDFSTEAVFSMDVDMTYTCKALQVAMETWRNQANQTHTAVGFFPRHLPSDRFLYSWNEAHWEPFTRNTLFITKGGLLHKDRFNDYFHPSLQSFVDHVDEHITGEDLLMSYMLARKDVKMITLCLPRSYWCNTYCAEGAETLSDRSAHHREHMMTSFRDHFGHISTNETNNPIFWHGESSQEEGCNHEWNACANDDDEEER